MGSKGHWPLVGGWGQRPQKQGGKSLAAPYEIGAAGVRIGKRQ